ncbi:MAG: nucleotidyltransferase [Erysipelotrichaceae bacterium]|nr:nucleotidyltransferase [Erysipelotrichaceae bacterium]
MKAVGLIVEYNPFTNGHLYHLQKAKEITNADLLIGVISPSFVQRGEPAIISKEKRVKIALEAGIDIVIELPFIYAVENADFFAFGALNLLNDLGVTEIVFGSETGDTQEFLKKYNFSSIVQPHLDFLIKDFMKEGLSYPSAMNKALKEIDSFQLETPNDILGFAYKKIIDQYNLPIKIHTIKRNADYKDENLNNLASASALRKAIKENRNIDKYTPFSNIKDFHYLDDYFDLLKNIIIMSSPEELATYHLVNEGIEYLFKKKILESNSMEEFIKNCISKRYTAARIKRIIIHILAKTNKQESISILKNKPPYVRILGINKKGEEYLKLKRKDIVVPVLNRFEGKRYPLLNLERRTTYLYYINSKDKNKHYEEELYLYPIRKME